MHTLSDKAFKGTVVNRTLPSLQGGSIEINLAVLLAYDFLLFHKTMFHVLNSEN